MPLHEVKIFISNPKFSIGLTFPILLLLLFLWKSVKISKRKVTEIANDIQFWRLILKVQIVATNTPLIAVRNTYISLYIPLCYWNRKDMMGVYYWISHKWVWIHGTFAHLFIFFGKSANALSKKIRMEVV